MPDTTPSVERPNILLLMTDQQRADFTAAAGFGIDTMPFVDSLAAAGTRFSRAYTTSPACVPARTSLLTGRYPRAHRVRQNSNAAFACYEQDLTDVLRAAGYRLHFAGKPHMHAGPDAFDDYRGDYFHTAGPAGRATGQEGASIYAESGFGGLPYRHDEHPPLHFDYRGPTFDELNSVTQSGQLAMVREGPYKLLFDSLGRGELYDLDADPLELVNRYDDLPTGRYQVKRATHNWYSSGG